MRFVRIAVAWGIVLALCYFAYRWIAPLFAPDTAETDVQTHIVERGDLRMVVPADGVVQPAVMVEVKSKAAGVVEAMQVEPGDEVEQGDVLVELDKEQIQARLRQAEASLASAEARLTKTRRNLSPQQRIAAESQVRTARINRDNALDRYQRIAELHKRGYATDQELDDAQATLENAEENLKQAEDQLELDLAGGEPEDIAIAEAEVLRSRAEVDDMREEMGNTTIRAALSGTVLTRPVEIGTAVASGTSGLSGGTVVATIGDLRTLYVQARIDETNLGRVSVGTPCRITFDAYTDWLWRGTLKKIYPQGTEGQNGTQFRVDIELDLDSAVRDAPATGRGPGSRPGMGGGPPSAPPSSPPPQPDKPAEAKPELRPQMTANVEIVLEDHPDVLLLPANYVLYDEGKPYCEVELEPGENGMPGERERRDLTLGFSDGIRHEVLTGLNEGDTVVLERNVRPQRIRF